MLGLTVVVNNIVDLMDQVNNIKVCSLDTWKNIVESS